mgnify:FL=1
MGGGVCLADDLLLLCSLILDALYTLHEAHDLFHDPDLSLPKDPLPIQLTNTLLCTLIQQRHELSRDRTLQVLFALASSCGTPQDPDRWVGTVLPRCDLIPVPDVQALEELCQRLQQALLRQGGGHVGNMSPAEHAFHQLTGLHVDPPFDVPTFTQAIKRFTEDCAALCGQGDGFDDDNPLSSPLHHLSPTDLLE